VLQPAVPGEENPSINERAREKFEPGPGNDACLIKQAACCPAKQVSGPGGSGALGCCPEGRWVGCWSQNLPQPGAVLRCFSGGLFASEGEDYQKLRRQRCAAFWSRSTGRPAAGSTKHRRVSARVSGYRLRGLALERPIGPSVVGGLLEPGRTLTACLPRPEGRKLAVAI